LGSSYDFSHYTTPDGIEGIIEAEKPDVVIMDILMPGVEHDGATATLAIKENNKFKNMPVIILTSIATGTTVTAGVLKQKTKADKVFLKPFDYDDFRSTVTELTAG
jgi:CheY-like chemotaxis protein